VIDLSAELRLNHHTQVIGGVLAAEAESKLKHFFALRRKQGLRHAS
jgi:tRNA(adenine34) deaminase